MNLCLNMIVKNESARIERALASVAPYITSWVIIDTGSTDDTKEKIVRFFQALQIPGEIREEPFIDWSQARNAALGWARRLMFAYEPDYYLMMDADMELVVKDHAAFTAPRAGAAFDMWQVGGAVHYINPRLVSVLAKGGYKGVTHEYLDITSAGQIVEDVAYFRDYADGANRPDKYKRDIRLLKKDLQRDPTNARSFFYLAGSYRDAKQPERAAIWYQRRIAASGWDEEVFQARLSLAHCYKDMGKEPEFISHLLAAYNSRPTRAEPMFDLAKHYREQLDAQPAALAVAEAVEHLPKPPDTLFVNDFVYKAGIQEEIAITSWYVPGKHMKGYRAAAALAQANTGYWNATNTARNVLYHYVFPLAQFCPSFKWKRINYVPPENWVALNPSVCIHHEALHCNVRLVNYRIDDAGRYLIRNTETGEITRENPIHTRNVVLYMGSDPFTDTHPWEFECYRDGNMPVAFPLVVGYEDMRLFGKGGFLWGSSCVRQLAEDGVPEQVLSKLVPIKALGQAAMQHQDDWRMLREKRECEKNWAPILAPGPQLFMWRPGIVVNTLGETVHNNPPEFLIDNISGSSQVIPWANGYIAVVHTAHPLPNENYKRYYTHRFITYDYDFKVKRMSLPFYFNDKGIEFCAGLCAHPTTNELVISYGHQDNDARIATVSCDDVEAFLCAS